MSTTVGPTTAAQAAPAADATGDDGASPPASLDEVAQAAERIGASVASVIEGKPEKPGPYVLRVEATTRAGNQFAFRELPFEVKITAPRTTTD